MEQTLGSITHYLNLRANESLADGFQPAWLPIEFERSRVPWAISGSMRARRALDSLQENVDGYFFHTTTVALLGGRHFRSGPAILSTDATPLNKATMRSAYGLKEQSRLSARLKTAVYRRVFRQAAGFVAWSEWAKASLVEDYGCAEKDVAVIPPGIDLDAFAPKAREHDRPRILFVGGDFARKGGDLLLDVFRKRLRQRADLVLVTRATVPAEPGVEVHEGVAPNSAQLRELYAGCDVFALPTRADCYSVACMEALAAGLPVATTRVGGIADIVREGETGHLVDMDDAAALGDSLEALVTDASRRVRMAAAARKEAARRFEVRENARRLFEFVRSHC